MELKDTFTNRYFKPEMIKSQMDLINQPTEVDAHAEGVAASAKASNNSASRNLLSGYSSGLKGAANKKRQEQLEPLLKRTGEINARAAYLESQNQEAEDSKIKVKKLFNDNSYNLRNFASANLAKDSNALNEVSPSLLRSYRQLFNDKTIGAYSHTHDGTIFYENNESGKIEGVNIAELIAKSGINPEELWGDDAGQVMSGLSSGSREKHENTQELQRQQLEKGQADIKNVNSQTGHHNAQVGEIENKIAPEYQQQERHQKGIDSRSKHNSSVLIPEISTQYRKNNEISNSITEFKKILEDTTLTGGSAAASAWRFIAKQTGQDEAIVNAQNAGQFYFEWMSENSKGALSDRDMINYKETFASIDKNSKSSINILDRLEKKLAKQNTTFAKQLEIYDRDPTANLHSLDILNHDAVNKGTPDGQNQRGNTVIMRNANGEPFQIPAEMVDSALNDPDEPLTLVQ
jgi:uncharacterized membrane-anchored protein YhcB (DUF1043 family)